jgi:hypothetical protein
MIVLQGDLRPTDVRGVDGSPIGAIGKALNDVGDTPRNFGRQAGRQPRQYRFNVAGRNTTRYNVATDLKSSWKSK